MIFRVQQADEETLTFLQLFISGVLQAETEVDFETRLQLESMVRGLNDQEVLNQWQKFVESQTEVAAQESVVDLLKLVVDKLEKRTAEEL